MLLDLNRIAPKIWLWNLRWVACSKKLIQKLIQQEISDKDIIEKGSTDDSAVGYFTELGKLPYFQNRHWIMLPLISDGMSFRFGLLKRWNEYETSQCYGKLKPSSVDSSCLLFTIYSLIAQLWGYNRLTRELAASWELAHVEGASLHRKMSRRSCWRSTAK